MSLALGPYWNLEPNTTQMRAASSIDGEGTKRPMSQLGPTMLLHLESKLSLVVLASTGCTPATMQIVFLFLVSLLLELTIHMNKVPSYCAAVMS